MALVDFLGWLLGDYRLILKAYAERTDGFFFIQIGSNDGVSGDPIHEYILKYGWSGILVEPVKYISNKLVKNYEGREGLTFENVAISDKEGSRKLYRLKENVSGLPVWYEQLGSFLPDVVLNHKQTIRNIEDYLVTETVPCTTFAALLAKHNVERIDLLNVDAEGYDFEIIKAIDFTKVKPQMILYEHKHLSRSDDVKCMGLLRENHYRILRKGADVFAYLSQN